MAKNKKTIIPPSLKPRKMAKKSIPGSQKTEKIDVQRQKTTLPKSKTAAIQEIKPEIVASSPTPPPAPKTEKKRFTLWLNGKTYQAFKVHVAMSGGSASDYIESLIKKDLDL